MPGPEAVEPRAAHLAPNKRSPPPRATWATRRSWTSRVWARRDGEGPYKPGKRGFRLFRGAAWRALRADSAAFAAASVEACQTCGAETAVCEISNKRRCSVGKFKGRVLVNIREYYEKDGQLFGRPRAALSADAAAIRVATAGCPPAAPS